VNSGNALLATGESAKRVEDCVDEPREFACGGKEYENSQRSFHDVPERR